MQKNQYKIDQEDWKLKKLDTQSLMVATRKQFGKGYFSQTHEILSLARGIGKLSHQDYFYYRLYDDERYTIEDKRRFLSDSMHWGLCEKCCDVRYWASADDKFIAETLLSDVGAPVAKTQGALFLNPRKINDSIPNIQTKDDLHLFFSKQAQFPLFAKPIDGIASFGVFSMNRYDSSLRVLELSDGSALSLDDFFSMLPHTGAFDIPTEGYLFQERLLPHKALQQVCGSAVVSTVRVIVIIEEGVPEIIQTVWKIPSGKAIADNFWRPGNMLADIDRDKGSVKRVVRGYGPQLEELENHPDSGKQLKGFMLPQWEEVRNLCLDFSLAYSKLRYQSWDIAICEDRAVVVEVNAGSAFSLSQLASGEGMLNDRFKSFLNYCGYPPKAVKRK
jgi:hypothetical protein